MNKIYNLFLLASCAAVCAVSCEKSVETIENDAVESIEQVETKEPQIVNISIPFPAMESANGTKVTMNPATGATQWVAGDKIVIYGKPVEADPTNYVVHTIAAGEIVNPAVANISVDVSAIGGSSYYCSPHHYSIAYPADDWSFYSKWSSDGRGAFSNTNQLLLGGYIADDLSSATLFNLNAAIVFKVSGDYDTYYFSGNDDEIVGFSRYVFNMNADTPKYILKYGTETYGTLGDMTTISGPVNGDGTTDNFIYIPQHHKPAGGENESEKVTLSSGFTILLAKGGEIKKYITSSAGLSLDPGHYIDLGLLPSESIHDYTPILASEKATATELSNPKSANCYTVSAQGTTNDNKVFKFPAVKGNTYVKGSEAGTSVGTVHEVVVIWETWNTSSVTEKSIIKVVDYADGFIYFKTPKTLHEGNALIAAKDSGGNILWSWHIWVPATDVGADKYGLSGSVIMQDRNLGALVVSDKTNDSGQSSGLFYQWGRKDPFRAVRALSSNSRAKTAPADIWTTQTKQATLDEGRLNPTVMYLDGIWTSGTYTGLWSTTKTENDPCPVGYKVPAFGSGMFDYITPANYDAWAVGKYGFDAGTIDDGITVFPFSGFPYYSSGSFDYYDDVNLCYTRTRLWTVTEYSTPGQARALEVRSDNTVSCSGQRMGNACAIRCVAE